jgi:hypothetical protein
MNSVIWLASVALVVIFLGGCESSVQQEQASAAVPSATNPYPAGAETPLFWSSAQWRQHESPKTK